MGAAALLAFYAVLSFQRLEIIKMLLGSILMGLATPTEAAAVEALVFGLLVALNLQTAFLRPPVAMAAFYLKGVSPPHVPPNQIFAGMLPFMGIQVIAIILLYRFSAIVLWLPQVLYSR